LKPLVVLAALSFLVLPASSVESARPPALLTYGISYGPVGPLQSGGGLCVSRADGSRAVRLTARHDDREPAWSPRGRFVAFSRYRRKGPAISDVLVADTRGRVIANASRSRHRNFSGSPSWSPDGLRIAFSQGWTGSFVMVADRNGRNRRLLAEGGTPEWLRDGRIAFTAQDGISTIRPDGTDQRHIVQGTNPDFSPDGRKLAFIRWNSPHWESEVFVANADGSDVRQLTSSPDPEFDAAWSPDGRLIAITRWNQESNVSRVVVVNGETGEEHAVIHGPHSAFDPEWRPAVNLPRANRARCR
jgi:Tol biopolymer transport system component